MRNNRGIALLLAIVTMTLLMYIANEVSKEATVEYVVNSQAVNRLKAYYAAKSGVEISLARIKIYSQVQSQYGKMLGGNTKMIDMIWNQPLGWPLPIPDGMNDADKQTITEKVKESKMDASWLAVITDEGSKLDLADLVSKTKSVSEAAEARLTEIFESKMKNDEEWARAHQDLNPADIIANLIDWQDGDTTRKAGGDEASTYPDSQGVLPPNRAFRTVDELRLVAGMTDDVFNLLAPAVTTFGTRAINPNYATAEMFLAMDRTVTTQVVQEIMRRRESTNPNEGFFKSAEEFWSFVNASGANVAKEIQDRTALVFDLISNFRIRSVGQFGNSTREITAVVYDLPKAASRLADAAKKEDPGKKPEDQDPTKPPPKNPPGADTQKQNNSAQTLPKGPPRIVYWTEK